MGKFGQAAQAAPQVQIDSMDLVQGAQQERMTRSQMQTVQPSPHHHGHHRPSNRLDDDEKVECCCCAGLLATLCCCFGIGVLDTSGGNP